MKRVRCSHTLKCIDILWTFAAAIKLLNVVWKLETVMSPFAKKERVQDMFIFCGVYKVLHGLTLSEIKVESMLPNNNFYRIWNTISN